MIGNPPTTVSIEDKTEVVTQARKVISLAASKSLTGCLTFRDLRDPSINWQLYIRSGQLAYATSGLRRDERLKCLIRGTQGDLLAEVFPDEPCEYGAICNWWYSQGLPIAKLRQLLMKLTLEALVQILSMSRTTVELDRTGRVDPVLIETSLEQLPSPLWQMASQWQQWSGFVPSPYSYLYLSESHQLSFLEAWKSRPLVVRSETHVVLDPALVVQALAKPQSVYQIVTQLGVSVNNFVAWVIPLIQEGLVSLDRLVEEEDTGGLTVETPPDESETELIAPSQEPEQRHTVACIDDSKTVQKQVRGVLQMSGYDVLGITEPAQALTALVRQKPAAILMDVNMPDIDGYELCSMLRQSRQLRDIPIIMLTGRDGLLDRLRAKTLGVECYLTKPFNPERLVESIQKVIEAAANAES